MPGLTVILVVFAALFLMVGATMLFERKDPNLFGLIMIVIAIFLLFLSHISMIQLGRGVLAKDNNEAHILKIGAVHEVVQTMKVEDKTVVALRMPNGEIKYYGFSELPPKVFVKTVDGKYIPAPAVKSSD